MSAPEISADSSCMLFVGNLPFDVTKEDIFLHFKIFKPLTVKKVQQDQKCFAFIQLQTASDVPRAISKLDESILNNRPLVVRPRVPKGLKMDGSKFTKNDGCTQEQSAVENDLSRRVAEQFPDRIIYISNLPPNTQTEELQELLEDFGPENIKVCRRPGYCFAFIKLRSQEDAQQAKKKINGLNFGGCLIHCALYDCSRLSKSVSGPSDLSAGSGPRNAGVSVAPITQGNGKNRIFVDNLPQDATQEDLMFLFKDYGPVGVWPLQQGGMSSAVVEVNSPQNLLRALKQVNGSSFKGSRLDLVQLCNKQDGEVTETDSVSDLPPMPPLEPLPDINGEDGQTDEEKTKALILIPVEMRVTFIVQMLKDCFANLDWLKYLGKTNEELSLLVTNAYPRAPYFWALKMTSELSDDLDELQKLIEKQELQPLTPGQVQNGLRCVAQCSLLGLDQGLWSRCWVSDVFGDYAVVFFLDFGLTSVMPTSALCSFDDDRLWKIPPLAQPFLLPEGLDASHLSTVVHGRINGACSREPHILNFRISPEQA